MRRALLTVALVPALLAGAAAASTPKKGATPSAPIAASAPASAPVSTAPPPAAPAQPGPPAATPPPPADPTTTDIRCIIVGGALSQNSDPELQKLGNASMLFFWGRLEGRGSLDNIDARVIQEAAKLTAADLTAEVNVCGGIITAATQGLQNLGDAIQQQEAGSPGGK